MRSNYLSYPRSRRRLDEALSIKDIAKMAKPLDKIAGGTLSTILKTFLRALSNAKTDQTIYVDGEEMTAREFIINLIMLYVREGAGMSATGKEIAQEKAIELAKSAKGTLSFEKDGKSDQSPAEESYYRRGRSLSENRSYSNRPSRRYW